MIDISVPGYWYGPGTSKMREIAIRLSSIPWFTVVPNEGRQERAFSAVARHAKILEALVPEGGQPAVADIVVMRGPWAALHDGREALDPYQPWGPRWRFSSSVLGSVADLLRSAVESASDARNLVHQPLWPIQGVSNVVGGALVADSQTDRHVRSLIVDERDRCVAWALLCGAESRGWNAVLWELALGANVLDVANPFEPLVELYELGYFPMGWSGDRYDLFSPALSPAEFEGFTKRQFGQENRGENYLYWGTKSKP